jgi:hypothetical protein
VVAALSADEEWAIKRAAIADGPSPRAAEVTPNCFIVRDADGQQLAYVYYEDEPSAAKLVATRLDSSVPSAVGTRSNDNRLYE